MSTLKERIDVVNSNVVNGKTIIAEAITNKGVSANSSDTFPILANKISEIQSGSEQGDYLVTFWDFDGTILKQEYVNHGEDATPPDEPEHQYLVFDTWNMPYTNITEDTDIGAIYNTDDGATYIFIELDESTELEAQSGRLQVSNSSTEITIDWGDGNSDSGSPFSSNVYTHIYAEYGSYIIKVYRSSGSGTFNWIDSISVGYNRTRYVRKIYLGSNLSNSTIWIANGSEMLEYVSISNSVTNIMFRDCRSLKHIVLPNHITSTVVDFASGCYILDKVVSNKLLSTENYTFSNCYSLQHINIADELNIKNWIFNSCYNLKIFPSIIKGNPTDAVFSSCYSLKKITISDSITSIGNSIFGYCYNLRQITVLRTTPPTLNSSAFNQIFNFKIYVPDESVEAYKTATNWTQYASRIYPLSQKPE